MRLFPRPQIAFGWGGAAYAAAVPLVFALDWSCPFLAMTGLPCPGCGISRAALSVLDLNIAGAFGFNQLVFIAPVVLSVVYLTMRKSRRRDVLLIGVAAALTISFTVLRWTYLETWPGYISS